MQKSFWWWQCSDRYIISPSPPPPYLLPPISPSLRSLVVSVDVKHHVYLLAYWPLTLLSSLQSYMYTCTSKARSALLSWLRAQSLAAPCLLVLYLWAALVWVSCTSSSEVLALSCFFSPFFFLRLLLPTSYRPWSFSISMCLPLLRAVHSNSSSFSQSRCRLNSVSSFSSSDSIP